MNFANTTLLLAQEWADIREPVTFINWWLWLSILALVILSGALIAIRIRRTQLAKRQPPPPEKPEVRARRELQQLAASKDQLDPEHFVVAVSGILRRYLEDALRLPAPERTTEEFLEELSRNPIGDAQLQERLSTFLQSCDMVKFARQSLQGEQKNDLLSTAHDVVEVTAPTAEKEVAV